MSKRKIIVIAAILIAVVLIGEAYIYTFTPSSKYSIDNEMTGPGLSYSVHSDIASTYDIVVTENGDFNNTAEYYTFYDESYRSPFSYKDTGYYRTQLTFILEKSNIELKTKTADELRSSLSSDVTNDTCNKALIIFTGSLPGTVYTGNPSDLIFDWISNGGRLYWMGNVVGEYSSTQDSLNYIGNSSMLFLGSECINRDISKAYSVNTDNGYCNALHLQNNGILFGADSSQISGRQCLSVGYRDDDCSSVSLIESGKGMVCLMGGQLSAYQRMDLAQILSSQICYKSALIDHIGGNVIRQTVSGDIAFAVTNQYYSVYTYLGGDFTEYCRTSIYLKNVKLQ